MKTNYKELIYNLELDIANANKAIVCLNQVKSLANKRKINELLSKELDMLSELDTLRILNEKENN